MKKHILFVLMLMALSLAATAQNKKIAILETVDKKGNVPYGVCLQLRSSLTYAISSTPGYEGYDRVDMSSIMGEHDFQRTGMVSDEQIKKLGAMTGCSSILVAEAAVYDASHIIITAKILDVETASVESSVPPIISSIDPEKMQKACEEAASKLLVVEEPPVEVVEFVEQRLGLLTKENDFWGTYYALDGKKLTTDEYMELINNCPESRYYYGKGCRHSKIGNILLITGGGCVVAGIVMAVVVGGLDGIIATSGYFNNGTPEKIGLGLSIIGIPTSIISIPIIVSGNHKKNNVYQVYNEYCAKPTATLSFGPATKGMGMGVYLSF